MSWWEVKARYRLNGSRPRVRIVVRAFPDSTTARAIERQVRRELEAEGLAALRVHASPSDHARPSGNRRPITTADVLAFITPEPEGPAAPVEPLAASPRFWTWRRPSRAGKRLGRVRVGKGADRSRSVTRL